jgi:hypothetical protein
MARQYFTTAVASAALAAAAFGATLPAQADWYEDEMRSTASCNLYAPTMTNHAARASCLAIEADAYAEARMERTAAREDQSSYRTAQAEQRRTDPYATTDERVPVEQDYLEQRGDADRSAQPDRQNQADREAMPAERREARTDNMTDYTVKDGDTLWKIAEAELGEGERYREIVEANRSTIADPDMIFPGEELQLPSRAG